jgi:ribosomal protein L29
VTHLKTGEIRKMQTLERKKKLEEMRSELLDMRSQNSMGGTLTNPAAIAVTRRSIARLLTVMRELNEA